MHAGNGDLVGEPCACLDQVEAAISALAGFVDQDLAIDDDSVVKALARVVESVSSALGLAAGAAGADAARVHRALVTGDETPSVSEVPDKSAAMVHRVLESRLAEGVRAALMVVGADSCSTQLRGWSSRRIVRASVRADTTMLRARGPSAPRSKPSPPSAAVIASNRRRRDGTPHTAATVSVTTALRSAPSSSGAGRPPRQSPSAGAASPLVLRGLSSDEDDGAASRGERKDNARARHPGASRTGRRGGPAPLDALAGERSAPGPATGRGAGALAPGSLGLAGAGPPSLSGSASSVGPLLGGGGAAAAQAAAGRSPLRMAFELCDVDAALTSARIRRCGGGGETAEYVIVVTLRGPALRRLREALRDRYGVLVEAGTAPAPLADAMGSTVDLLAAEAAEGAGPGAGRPAYRAAPAPRLAHTPLRRRARAPSAASSATARSGGTARAVTAAAAGSPVAATMTFAVRRRYSEFAALDAELRAALAAPYGIEGRDAVLRRARGDRTARSDLKRHAQECASAQLSALPTLPPSTWFRTVDPAFVSRRREALSGYLHLLLAMVRPRYPSEPGFGEVPVLDRSELPGRSRPDDLGRLRCLAAFLDTATRGRYTRSGSGAYLRALGDVGAALLRREGTMVPREGAAAAGGAAGERSEVGRARAGAGWGVSAVSAPRGHVGEASACGMFSDDGTDG